MRFLSILLFIIGIVNISICQLQDNFSDGNISANPTWVGDLSNFIVNSNLELQLMAPSAGQSKLFTNPVIEQDTTYWRGKLKMDFAPSATNLLRIYLQMDDTTALASGYFIEMGENGSNDAIKFFRQDTGKVKLIGYCKLGAMANAPSIVSYEIRKINGNWSFSTDYTGGNSLQKDSIFFDDHYKGNNYKWTGIYCLYTDTRKDKFFFDDFYIGGPLNDKIPPQLLNIQLIDNKTIKLIFDEPLELNSIKNLANYSVDNSIGNPIAATLNFEKEITLTFQNPFNSFIDYKITIQNVTDLNNNKMNDKTLTFQFQLVDTVKPFDLIINEIMADPTPVVSLPELEYIEIYNRSDKYLNLNELQLLRGATKYKMPKQVLPPKSYVILCNAAASSQFVGYGSVAPMTTFPSLTNTGDNITLVDTLGNIIHSIQYDDDWYGSSIKKNGGYSLELKNPNDICNSPSQNWTGSNDFNGGTPGKENSVFLSNNSDFEIKYISLITNTQIQVNYSKLLNINLINSGNFLINGSNSNISSVQIDSSAIIINLNTPLKGDGLFQLQFNNIYSCDGSENITDIYEFYLDKPHIQSVNVLSDKQIQVDFSIDMLQTSVLDVNNFTVSPTIGTPSNIIVLNSKSILLNFNSGLISGETYNMQMINVLSSFETTLKDTIIQVKYFSPTSIDPYDLLINEVMADPSPTVGLPDAEYIEIYKNTTKYINLKDLKLVIGSNEISLPDYDFKGSTKNYVVIYTNKLGVDFGTADTLSVTKSLNLTNDGTTISLVFGTKIIDAIAYSSADYQDGKKSEGGWSLERIFNQQPCRLDSIFIASKDLKGGTPGAINSVQSDQINHLEPYVTNIGIENSNIIRVKFSSKINLSNLILSNFSVDNGLIINNLIVNGQGESVDLVFDKTIEKTKIYTLTITLIEDCVGNKNVNPLVLQFANPDLPKVNELVINEILYDPYTGGVDFVELYNRSQIVIDIKSIKIANITDNQQDIESIDISKLIFPGEYIVLTSDKIDINSRYKVKNPSSLLQTKMPSFNDGVGNVSILVTDPFGFQIIDSINYDDNMHAPFLNFTSGVSLERINPNETTSNRSNWHSAASTAGYATPTYQNSQYFSGNQISSDSIFRLPYSTFSPDGDGFRDFLSLQINVDNSDYQASIFIYDANGRIVKKLLDNQYISRMDNIIWSGETSSDSLAPMGIYILDCRLQNSNGTTKHEKLTCVLANKLD